MGVLIMSVFGSIWLGVKTIFGANPDKGADMASGIGNFIDESFHTDQEKSEARLKFLDFRLKWANATQGQNLARRYCAIMFGLNFIFTFQVGLAIMVYGFFAEASTKIIIDQIIGWVVAFQLGWIMLAIIGFYFGKEFTMNNKK